MLVQADARALPLRDGCVQTCITSPPYWGLRDYGTARWEGGDASCPHFKLAGGTGAQRLGKSNAASKANVERSSVVFRDVCGLCGARRIDAQLGLEPTPDAYVSALVAVCREVRRVLRDDGTLWLNLGDSYAPGAGKVGERPGGGAQGDRWQGLMTSPNRLPLPGLKPKDLVGIPWRVAFALQADGWYLRQDLIWHKPNPMPESVRDRCTKAHEYVFLLAKSPRYYWDASAIAESASYAGSDAKRIDAGRGEQDSDPHRFRTRPVGRTCGYPDTRNRRSVWTVTTEPYPGAHYAVMPTALVEPMVLAGCPLGGLVLDPFCGTGTVLEVAQRTGRRAVGCDLAYHDQSKQRTAQRGLLWETA